ncbi:non-ribosomal peptide synthetase [Actinoalloteichus sp. GBA129-24]|uniref:non-ribosomal peptide synthetase n=1 Tax=Actinoalloteichus sp. GBA129-24 TaxID=1612551 RepID=UPI000950696D|nr:non-ribosomal peptide synthetase [Actinoalloteichus sp. GBA129-24]APU21087.1 amino acid adenylation enzyme/thioester reductase family protein [Actinoalloteichus sp. GBA129-24]
MADSRRDWECGARVENGPGRLWRLIAAASTAGGDRVAVVCGRRRLSYAELTARSAALARRLRAVGVGPERPVAVLVEDGLDRVVACLAVFRAGGVYLPLDPGWPAGRRAAVLADARPVVTVSSAGVFEEVAGPVLSVDGEAEGTGGVEAGDGVSGAVGWPDPVPGLAAYLTYTSGSTGRPKGVLLTHGALANRMLWWQDVYPLFSQDVVLATASPGFDIAVWELLAGLVVGARLVIAEHRRHGIVPYLPELMAAEGVTVAHLVPSVLDELVAGSADGERLGLRLTVCGGERVPPSLRDRLLARSDTRLVHAYGPTEATITVVHDEAGAGAAADRLPLGRPMHNCAVAVVDADGLRVPVGVAGELLVGGVPLARGYLGGAAATAVRFLPDWLGLDPAGGGRVYRTGDRVRWLADGRLEFLGRVDEEFKVRGHRVDPAEVESLLHRHPAVGRAVVRQVDGRVVAYLQGSGGAEPAGLRAHLVDVLPEAVIPTRWVFVERFPTTSTGKIDHAALPAASAGVGVPTDEAGTEVERELAALWSGLLGVDSVGVADDFFALGGHSLIAARIVAAVWRGRRVRLSMADVLAARTVAVLARRVVELSAGQAGAGPSVAETGEQAGAAAAVPAELPLSPGQARILFEEEFLGGPGLFTVSVPTRWRGPVSEAALRAALDGLVRRHPVLRSVPSVDDGPPRLSVADAASVPFRVEDLRPLDAAARERRVAAATDEAMAEPFDLRRPPLLRARLLRLAEEEHLFLLVLHHIVIDRWSMRVVAEELRELYAAALDGRAPQLAAPANPAVLTSVDASVRAERDLAYWRRSLDGAVWDVDLTVGPRRRVDHGHRAGRVVRVLSPEQTAALSAVCAARGVTPFMVLLAAFQVLLHRFSDAQDVVVAAPMADRDLPGAEAVVTMLVNTVPLRVDLRGAPRFGEVLEQCRAAVPAAYAHQAVPVERLAGALGRRRDAGHHPLMRHMVVWEDSLGTAVELPGVVAEPLRPPSRLTAFDLTLIARALPDGVDLELEFNHDVLDGPAAEVLADGFTALLADVLADPDLRIGAARLTTVAAAPVLAGPVEPPATDVPGLLRAVAGRTPGAAAVVDGSTVVDYAELVRHADVVAARIGAAGGRRGDVVGVCLPRSVDLVAALSGVLAAGCAFLPLSPDDPDDRLRGQLAISGARLVVSADVDRFARLGVVAVDPGSAGDPGGPGPAPQPAEAAYVLFTSGSTGEPKGVVVEHRALADHVRWAVREYGLSPADRVLQFCAVTFDVLVEEVFPTLVAGATVVLRDEASAGSVQALLQRCARHGVTVANLPTGYWERLVDALNDEGGLVLPSSLRLMVIGGQQVEPDAVAHWHRRAGGVRLVNAYGPTEVTIGATAADLVPGGGTPIGVPTANTRAYLLDRYLMPVPDGVVAELYLAGAGLARGYARRGGLTAERFLPDPFVGDGQRMYRTGDLARRDGGALHFVSRTDRQVKLRGFRIELDEVETVLAGHPSVVESAVVVRGDVLIAHVAAPAGVESAAVRAYAAGVLPAFMVPAVVAVTSALPRTAAGKIDRAGLVSLDVGPEPDEGYREPRTDRERAAAAVWAEALGVARVGLGDSFFALGGHSLLAMDLVRRMRGLGYPELRMPDLFANPTIEGLAPWAVDEPATTDGEPAAAAVVVDTAPLSWAQLAIWAQATTAGGSTFHLPVVLRLSGPLSVQTLRAATAALTDRHDLLRSVLAEDQDGPRWRPAGHTHALRVLDADDADPDGQLRALIAEPFDLAAAPPVRWILLRRGTTEHVLVIVLHHIAGDGWSARVLVRELAELYAARVEQRPAVLPAAASFLISAAADRAAPTDDAGLAFWAEALRGAPERLDLPAARKPDTPRDPGRHTVRVPLPASAAAALVALSRREDTTLFITVLAGVQAWLARCCGQPDVVVGTPVADRADEATAGMVGPLVSVLPIRVAVESGGSFTAHLARTRAAVHAAFQHGAVPTQQIVRQLGRSGRGLSQVVFDLDDDAAQETTAFADVTARTVPQTPTLGAFDLEITARTTVDGMDVELRGAADLLSHTGIAHLASALAHLLGGVAEQPDAAVAGLDLLGDRERHRLLVEPNRQTMPERPAEVLGLVTGWAVRTPDATAVTTSTGSLTYRELDALSDGVAAWLRERDLPVEGPVATRLGRCLQLPAVVLGIWKAGGVYVPLDPEQPTERHRRILADCRAHAVIADQADPVFGDTACLVLAELRPADPGPVRRPEPDQLAYVTYTSGSTGAPKGVQCTHRGLANQLAWSRQTYPLRPGDAGAQVAAVGFDISLWELFHPLACGGRLVVLDQDRHGDVAAIAELVAAQRVVVLHLVPTLLEHYLRERPAGSLRHVLCGGERLSPGLPARFAARLPAALHHTYGPTETAIIATHWRSPGGVEPGRVSLGRPLPNARVYVLDAFGQPVPAGVVGELVIGGEVLARGYLGNPAATADRFVPDPFADIPGARAYRTGDLARYHPEGGLEFVGRADRQVKIAGVRVEPHEVESALVATPGVAACAVLPYRDDGDGEDGDGGDGEDGDGVVSLVGYLVAEDPTADADALSAQVRRALRERLPRAMVPAHLVVLAELPIGVTGKLDVAALPAPVPAAAPATGEVVAPGSDVERALAAIWSQVLPVAAGRAIGVGDNFFDLGGDSVSAIRVAARARAAGLRVELGQVLRAATLADLAVAVVPIDPAADAAAPLSAAADGRLWLTPAQRRFLAGAARETGHFNQAVLTEPTERIDPARLRAALRAVAAHHDAFRLRAVWDDGRWQDHAVLASAADALATVLVADAPVVAADVEEWARPVHAAVDVEHGPTLAALVGERAEGGQVVLLVAHHLAIDTASWETVLSDLDSAYRQVSRDVPVALPVPVTPFADFARAQPVLAARVDTPAQREHWRRGLADLPRLPLLPVLPAATGEDDDTAPVLLLLGAADTEALLAATAAHRIRVDEVLLAGVARVAARWTGDRRVAVLRETHGRSGPSDWPDLTGTVGWLTGVYPVSVELPSEDPLAALRAVRAALAEVPDGGVGYGLLRADAGPEPDLVVNHLGSTTGRPGAGLFARAERQMIGAYAAAEHASVRGVEVISGLDDRGLWVEWLHDPQRFPRTAVRGLAEQLRIELIALVAALAGPFGIAAVPADFPAVALPAADLRAVLTARTGSRTVLPLSPAQQGMVAWHLARPGSVAYHTQILFEVDGAVDQRALRAAWQQVVEHTDVFRAAFPSAGLDEPVQVIGASPPVDWRVHTGTEADLDVVLAADRSEPFALAEPGPQRWHWIDGGARGRWLLWSHHHILLDGWSLPLVLADVAEAYAARVAGRRWVPPRRPGYDAYLAWLSTQDEQAGARFWRDALASAEPTRLGRAGAVGATSSAALVTADLPPAATRALTRLAERSRATLHSVVLAAWSLLLRGRCASRDLLFGVVMSLRPEEVPGSERLIGLCLNTVPLRVRIDDDAELPALFHQVQRSLVDGYQHAAHPLGRIRAWAGASDALFDSIVVFENYPGDRTGAALGEHGALRVVRAVESTEFAVSLTVLPGDRLTFELTHQTDALTSAEATGLVRRLARLLERIADSGDPDGRENP